MSSAPVPDGARCSRHPATDASATCARCGDFLCDACTRTLPDGTRACAACEPMAGEAFPWERRAELGVLRAFTETLAGTWTTPAALYARGFRDRSVVPALAFGLVLHTPITVAVTLLTIEPRLAEIGPLAWYFGESGRIVRAIASPATFVLGAVLFAAFWWIGLRAVGAPKKPFAQILRAIAYVQGACAPLAVAALLSGRAAPIVSGAALWTATLVRFVMQGRALSALTGASPLRVTAAALVMLLAIFAVLCGLATCVIYLLFPGGGFDL